MCNNTERSIFEIEKEIYNTQWNNIRHHWSETVGAVRFLSTLVVLSIFSLKFLKVTTAGDVKLGIDRHLGFYLKAFLVTIIFLMGLLTFLNQFNHYKRSKEARKVVVAIERRWNLYDENDNFIFQDPNTNYSFAKFAGGEKRLTHSMVQFFYIIVITLVGIGFVIFA